MLLPYSFVFACFFPPLWRHFPPLWRHFPPLWRHFPLLETFLSSTVAILKPQIVVSTHP